MSSLQYNTAARIIQSAYEDAGILQEGDIPNGDQWVKGLNRLNDIINFEQTQGLKLFLNGLVPVQLQVGVNPYYIDSGPDWPLGSKPLRVLEGYYIDPNGVSRPLIPYAWKDWNMLSQQNEQGALNSYFVDKQVHQLAVAFWQVPDATAAQGYVNLLVQIQVPQFITIVQQSMFPVEWFMFLRWELASELATGQPQEIVMRCAQRSDAFRTALENWDVEDAPTRFVMDQRSGFASRRFR